ncbi:AroM family protein [Lacticaseibacillus sp. GG6-2]
MKQLTMITIGQAPRQDVGPIIEKYLGARVTLVQSGALDGLDEDEIKTRFAPDGDEATPYLLTSRLTNGQDAVMTRAKLEPVLQNRIDKAEADGSQLILLLCTGEFPNLTTTTSRLVEPDRVLPTLIKLIIGDKRLGVVVPLPEQAETTRGKFTHVGIDPTFVSVSPYTGTHAEFVTAGAKLRQLPVDYILMDCMGFDEQMRAVIAAEAGKPVILSNALMAKILSEFI